MKRTLATIAVLILVQAGVEASIGGVASAMVVLGGSTNCTLLNGDVNFLPGLTATSPNGDEKAQVFGHVTCNTPNVTPAVTSLTGVFKGVIKFKKTPAPNKAQECANFNGASPVDKIVAPSKVIVSWTTNIGPARSVVMYTGAYSAIGSLTSMDLNFTPATAVVAASFAGPVAQLDMVLPIASPQCPVATGVNVASSGSLVM
jgi:hypothetical protein